MLYCPIGIGLVASTFVAAPSNPLFPKVQLASWKPSPSGGPVPLKREAQPSLYSHPLPVPSTLTSPNVSITASSRKSSIASFPLMCTAFERTDGVKPKNSVNFVASLLT